MCVLRLRVIIMANSLIVLCVSRGQPLAEPPPKGGGGDVRQRHEGFRFSATQLPWERDPHKAPKLGIPPGAVPPLCVAVRRGTQSCAVVRASGGGVECPASLPWDLSAQSGGASNLPSPWEVGTSGFWVKLFYFLVGGDAAWLSTRFTSEAPQNMIAGLVGPPVEAPRQESDNDSLPGRNPAPRRQHIVLACQSEKAGKTSQ